jgi:formyl-CoA transferase
MTQQTRGPLPVSSLYGLKVVEIAHLVAGPLAGSLLADLGADVVHVEQPGTGDHARTMGPKRDGHGLWWKVAGRNKRFVTINLRSAEGQALAAKLVQWADIVITNMKASSLREWGLDWPSVHELNPKVIYHQVTGYGVGTSRADEPGFGKAGEAMSGAVYGTGFPDGPPTHVGFQHGDAVTALMGAFAILAAVNRMRVDPDFDGEWIDLALFETLFRLNEWLVITYDQAGFVGERVGNRLPIAPAAVINTYQTSEGDWITVTSATLRAVLSVVELIGLDKSEYGTLEAQMERAHILDKALGEWMATRTTEECLKKMTQTGVVASPIYSIRDIFEDETYREREDIIEIEDPHLGVVRMQGVIPKLHQHGGSVWRSGGEMGEDNEFVIRQWLGLSQASFENLVEQNAI